VNDFTPTTKRIIVGGISFIAIGAVIGWCSGLIDAKDAVIIIMPIITGFFSLLKGVE